MFNPKTSTAPARKLAGKVGGGKATCTPVSRARAREAASRGRKDFPVEVSRIKTYADSARAILSSLTFASQRGRHSCQARGVSNQKRPGPIFTRRTPRSHVDEYPRAEEGTIVDDYCAACQWLGMRGARAWVVVGCRYQEYLYTGKLTRKGIEGSDPVSYFLSSFTPCDACATSGLRVVEKPRMRF